MSNAISAWWSSGAFGILVAVQPLVRAAVVAAVLAAVTRWSDLAAPRAQNALRVTAPSASASQGPTALCPPGTLPDAHVCIPVPARVGTEVGVGSDQDQIPRHPDRPQDFARYELPVKDVAGVHAAAPVGLAHPSPGEPADPAAGGVDIETSSGQEVHVVALENQTGPGILAFVGEFIGTSIVVRLRVHEAGEDRNYLTVYGRLSGLAPGIEPGQHVEPGALLGLAGGRSPTGGTVVHLQIRRIRQGIEPEDLQPEQVLSESVTVAEDSRNVLRIK